MGRVCMGRLGNGPSLQWAEFAMGRDVQLPFYPLSITGLCLPVGDLFKVTFKDMVLCSNRTWDPLILSWTPVTSEYS